MALAMNKRTGKVANVPDHYIGHPVLGAELVAVGDEPVETVAPKTKKKPAKYVPDAVDGDGDGLVQDGTVWERPEGTEVEGQVAPDEEIENNEE